MPFDNKILLGAWLNAIGRDESYATTLTNENSFICSSHFSIDDYVLENGIYEISPSAIPSKNIGCENSTINSSTVTNGNNELNNYNQSTYNNTNNESITKYIKQEQHYETLTSSDYPMIIDVQGGSGYPNYLNNGTFSNNFNENESMDVTNVSSNTIHNNSNFNIDNRIINQICEPSTINISPKFTTNRTVVLPTKDNDPRMLINNQHYISTSTNNIHNELSSNVQIVDVMGNDVIENNYLDVPASIPFESPNKPKFKIKSTKSIMSKSTSVNLQENNINSNAWITNSLSGYKYKLPNKFFKKLQTFARKNRRLVSKVKTLMTRNQDLLDTEIKYLELKAKVLETEEKLLKNGINTLEYSAFQRDNDNGEISKDNNDIEYDVLVECKLNEINNKSSSNNNSMLQSTNYSELARN